MHVSPNRAVLRSILSVTLCVLGACSSDEGADKQAAGAPAAGSAQSGQAVGASGGPAVQVSADKTHAVQPGDEITLTVAVTDFVLEAAAMGSPAKAGQGHYRVYLDDASGEAFLAESSNPTTKVKIPEDVTDGSHELRVKLYNNDKTPFEPATEASVLLIVYRL